MAPTMGAAFRILCVSRGGAFRAPLIAQAMAAALSGMGLEGVQVVPAGLHAALHHEPALAEALASLGGEVPEGSPRELTAEMLEEAELVLCTGPLELAEVMALTSVRAYTVLDYLGRTDGTEAALEAHCELHPAERAGLLAALARHLAEQIGREVESDPARPGAAARD